MEFNKEIFLNHLFKDVPLTNDQRSSITDAYRIRQFSKNEFLLEEGNISGAYYVIMEGLVRTFAVDTEGNDITTGFIVAGEMILEPASFLLRQATKENIQALANSTCLEMPFDKFQYLFSTIDSYRNWARAMLVQNYAALKNRSIAQITDSAKKRYLDLQNTRPEIIQSAPLKHIATYLGMTDTSLSRIRKAISEQG